MRTSLIYMTGAALMSLMVQQSAGQYSSFRAKQEAQTRERFNFFDLDLLKVLASSQNGNLLLSPTSVKSTLAMLMEGAEGNSAKQVKEALRLPDEEKTGRQYFSNLISSLQVNKPPNVVEAGNRIFLSTTFNPQQHFQNILKKYYDAEIERVNFVSPVYAAQSINEWVNKVTHGQIPTLVEPGSISKQTSLMLASAVYFKGKWQRAFDVSKTTQKCFYVDVDQCFMADFMENSNSYNYAYMGSLQAHAVELPYEGNKFSLLLLVPTTRNTIQQLIRDLSHTSLHNIVSSLERTDIQITLPRFSIDYSTDLIRALYEVGIQEVFSTNANLRGMINWNNYELHVSNFLHKAKIEVNEEGTVAAAATGTLVVPLMGTSVQKINFDHPFLFFLRNTETGDILFAGRTSQPDAAKQQVLGSMNDPYVQQLTKDIFATTPVAGPGLSLGSAQNSGLASSNTYNPLQLSVSLAGPGQSLGSTQNFGLASSNTYNPPQVSVSVISYNKSRPVAQTQPPVTNYQAPPNNQNTANNNPSSTYFQPYQGPHQTRSVSNNLPQPNTAQHHPYSYSETYQPSNPDTIGQNVPSLGQPLSASGSYVPAINTANYFSAEKQTPEESGVQMADQANTERPPYWP